MADRVSIRTLIGMSPVQIRQTLPVHFTVECDDGAIKATRMLTWISSFAWQFFKDYPLKRYEKQHHFASYYNGKDFKSTSHHAILESCGFSVMDEYPNLAKERIAELIMEYHNEFYNAIVSNFGEFVSSIDIFDFLDLMDHPDVKAIADIMEPTEESITASIEQFEKMVLDPNSGIGQMRICKMAQAKLIKLAQLTQNCLVRGFCQDVDSSVFTKPVMRSFVEGIRSMSDAIAESRSAAVAITFSEAPLQMAEYSSRKMQFMDQVIANLHAGDCGSQKYMSWTVRGPQYDEFGRKLNDGDLSILNGKYYHDGESLKIVWKKDTHLLGKTIKLRTTLDCMHPDPYGVCEICWGKLSDTFHKGTNLGHSCATTLNEMIVQGLLSAKHVLGSSDIERIILDAATRLFLTSDPDGTNYLVNSKMVPGTYMLLSPQEALNLTDVNQVDNVLDLEKSRISAIKTVAFQPPNQEPICVNVGLKRRAAMLSYAALEYIKQKGWEFDSKGNYKIDLTDWDVKEPILSLPLRNYNMADHSKDLADFIEARAAQMHERDKLITPHAFLLELSDLVNSRNKVSLAILEIVLKGLTIVSAEERNYNVPKPWERAGIGVLNPLMNYRSGGVVLAYKGHRAWLKDPASFVLADRPDHPMDVLLMPYEVIQQSKFYD